MDGEGKGFVTGECQVLETFTLLVVDVPLSGVLAAAP